jgi:polar amino acid transport system substrate-binding protein
MVLALCAVVGPQLARADEVERYCSRPMRLAFFEFGMLYRGATGDGMDVRLIDAIAQHTGCQFVNVTLPRNRIWSELQVGALDVATAAIATPERRAYGYLLPYTKSRNVVLMRRTDKTTPTTLEEFEQGDQRMGVVRGFRHEPAYDALIARLRTQDRVVEAVDVTDDLRLLERGVVGAILSQPLVYRGYFSEEELVQKFVLRDWAPQDEFAVGSLILARKSFTPEQARNWDALLVRLLKDGTLLKINSEFFPSAQARDMLYTGPRTPD